MIGDNIRDARIKAGIAQGDLAKMLDVTQGAVSQWELGITKPSICYLPKIASILGTTVDDLIGGIDDETADHRASG